jgi:hypothetical protein
MARHIQLEDNSFLRGVPMRVRENTKLLMSCSVLFLLVPTLALFSCGTGKTQSASTQPVTVLPPAVSLSVSPAAVLPGQSATLTWSTASAVSCTAGGAWSGTQQMSGSINVTLPSATGQTYTLECTSASGQSASSKATLSLSPTDGPCTTNQAVAANGKRNSKRRLPSGTHS